MIFISMKKIVTILFLAFLSSCYISQPLGYVDINQNKTRNWDPVYYVRPYYDPFLYGPYGVPRVRPEVIIIDRGRTRTPVIVRPQEPRRNAFGPTAPPSAPRSPKSSPIRTFPKNKDK
jgi:hypothetical protein